MNEAVSILDELSTFEVIALTYLQREAMFMNMTIFLTLLTGFLVLAYLMANKLSRLEAVAVSFLYSGISVFLVFDYSQVSLRAFRTVHYLLGNEPNGIIYAFVPILMAAGWLISIWYMFSKMKSAT